MMRELRLAHEWHIDDLGVRAHLSHGYLVQLELGSRLPSRGAVVALATAFEMDVEQIVEFTLRAAAERVLL